MNKNKSQRSKRRRIQEQLFAYTSDDVPVFSTNVLSIGDDQINTYYDGPTTNLEILPDVSNTTIDFSPIISATEIPNINSQQMSFLNQISTSPQNEINKLNTSCPPLDNVSSMCSMLSTWALNYSITHSAFDGLLLILQNHSCFLTMPRDSRSILKTKSIDNTRMRVIDSGKYYHFGLSNGIEQNFQHDVTEIKLVIGIDGLPISKSTSTGLLRYLENRENLELSGEFLIGQGNQGNSGE